MGFNSEFKGLIDCFNIVTLGSSYSALPDDGGYTETCWSCINVNFDTHFKQFFCASVGNKTLRASTLSV